MSRAPPLGTRDDLDHTVQSFVSSLASRIPARSVHLQSGAPQYRIGSKIPAPPHPSLSGRGLQKGAGLAAARCEWLPLRLRSLMAEAWARGLPQPVAGAPGEGKGNAVE